MNASGHKTRGLPSLLLMGVCLAANGLCAQGSSTANGAPKPVGHSPAGSTQPTAPHTVAKKAATPTTPSHSATNQKPAPHSGTAPTNTRKTTTNASPGYAAKGTPTHTTAHASQRTGSTARNRSSASWHPRTLTGQQRLARLHLQPERVQEIQQALIREGYLQGDANGQWDAHTHDAMLRYQTDHGFPATGLPEAKSLMKLGLGSHPLPQELDHGLVGGGIPGAAPGDLTVTPPSPPVSQATPPN